MIASLEITRPHNGALTFLSVLLGGWLATAQVGTSLILAAASSSLIASGGYVFNDVYGLEADRVNRPERPLPSGRLSPRFARAEAGVLLAVGIAISFFLPYPVPILALAASASLVAYNVRLQRVPVAGNLTIAGLGALAFLYGGAAVRNVIPAVVPAVFAFVYHLGREILKDAEDLSGDRRLGGSTLPNRWGEAAACRVSAACCLLVVLLSPLPYLYADYGRVYLGLVALLDGLLLDVAAAAWSCPSGGGYRALNRLLKVGMMMGLAALFGDRYIG